MFELDNKKICKLTKDLDDTNCFKAVFEELVSAGMLNDDRSAIPAALFETVYMGSGVAISIVKDDYRKLVKKTDFRIFYFVKGFPVVKSNTVHIVICFTCLKSTHIRNFERISQVVFNCGSDVFFDTERNVEDICCWVAGDSVVKNFITIEDVVYSDQKYDNVKDLYSELKFSNPKLYEGTLQILSPVLMADNVYCEVLYKEQDDHTSLVPIICKLGENQVTILSVLAGKDMLYATLLNTLSVAACYDNKSVVGVSRETLLKNIASLPLKITKEDRERLVKLREIGSGQDEWRQIEVEIKNEQGLHARPAVVLTKIARMFKCPVWVRRADKPEDKLINAKDFMQILTMSVEYGEKLIFSSTGTSSERALKVISEAAENMFSGEYYQKVLARLSFTLDDD